MQNLLWLLRRMSFPGAFYMQASCFGNYNVTLCATVPNIAPLVVWVFSAFMMLMRTILESRPNVALQWARLSSVYVLSCLRCQVTGPWRSSKERAAAAAQRHASHHKSKTVQPPTSQRCNFFIAFRSRNSRSYRKQTSLGQNLPTHIIPLVWLSVGARRTG